MTSGAGPVIETVVTTLDERGEPHFASMGVVWSELTIVIRPYTNTRTFRHLQKRGAAVVNVTDDVLAFAKSALTHERLDGEPAAHVRGVVLRNVCHWREVEVSEIAVPDAVRERVARGVAPEGSAAERRPSASAEAILRADVVTRVVGGGSRRAFAGLCRAKHAVVEASILASRVRFLPLSEIVDGIRRLEPLVEKTGGPEEREAFSFIRSYLERRIRAGNTR